MTQATDFHREALEMELQSIQMTIGQYTETFGVMNWKADTALEIVYNSDGYHPLKDILGKLAGWLDEYEAGTATAERWVELFYNAHQIQREADGLILEANNRNNPHWQAAKAAVEYTPIPQEEIDGQIRH